MLSLSSLPRAAMPGSVKPCKWREFPKGNEAMQWGEAVTCRGRTPRENAEGHANAEPQTKTKVRFRIRVGSPDRNTASHGPAAA